MSLKHKLIERLTKTPGTPMTAKQFLGITAAGIATELGLLAAIGALAAM
ncbi:hypothetical protein AB0N05_15470 [Nocardia sp. NPDC051030]